MGLEAARREAQTVELVRGVRDALWAFSRETASGKRSFPSCSQFALVFELHCVRGMSDIMDVAQRSRRSDVGSQEHKSPLAVFCHLLGRT